MATCDQLASHGFRITRVPVGTDGRLDPGDLARSVEPGTVLVSVMHANNEIGTVQPLAEIATVTRERGILLHTDAAQTLATVDMDVDALGVDLLTVVGHKMYAAPCTADAAASRAAAADTPSTAPISSEVSSLPKRRATASRSRGVSRPG
jgi:cysteine sulfinate desulfinase/cysteine desulfurase-like protein